MQYGEKLNDHIIHRQNLTAVVNVQKAIDFGVEYVLKFLIYLHIREVFCYLIIISFVNNKKVENDTQINTPVILCSGFIYCDHSQLDKNE